MWNQIYKVAVLCAGMPIAKAGLLTASDYPPNLPVLQLEGLWDLSALPQDKTQILRHFDDPVVTLENLRQISNGPTMKGLVGSGHYALQLHKDYDSAYFAQSNKDMRGFKTIFKLTHEVGSHPLYIKDQFEGGFPNLCLLKAIRKGAPDAEPEALQAYNAWRAQDPIRELTITKRMEAEHALSTLLKERAPLSKIGLAMSNLLDMGPMTYDEVFIAIVEFSAPSRQAT